MQEDTAAQNNFKPEVWHNNNKALIKAGNLKGLLRYPTYKLFGCTFAILKDQRWEDLLNQFSRPTTEDEVQFGRIEERPQLEDQFRGLLTVSWTRGTHHVVSRSVRLGRGPHGRILMGQFGQPLPHTRKTPQDLALKPRTLLKTLGLWCVI